MSSAMDWTSTSEVFQARGFSSGGDPHAKSPGGPQEKSPSQSSQSSGQQKSSGGGASGRAAGDKILALTTNYSVAPGPVWVEFTNKAAITGAGDIEGDVPLRGAGQLMAAGTWPLAVVVLPPALPPDQRPRWGDEAHPPKPPGWDWWPKDAWQPITQSGSIEEVQQKEQERVQKLEDEAKQKEEKQKQEYEEKQKEEEEKQKQKQEGGGGGQQQSGQQEQKQSKQAQQGQGRALGGEEVDEWMAITGMSPEGFPGFPRAISNQTALPTGMGVHSATIDNEVSPPEIKIKLVGTGTIPAKSRFIVFSLVGV